MTVELAQREADCEIVLIHERFPGSESAEQLVTGWNQILEKLSRRVLSGAD